MDANVDPDWLASLETGIIKQCLAVFKKSELTIL